MKQKTFPLQLLEGLIMLLVGCGSLWLVSCTEEPLTEVSTNPITFTIDDVGFKNVSAPTRGAEVDPRSIEHFWFGVSASAYDKDAAGGYTSAGCGSYFFKESAAPDRRTKFFWPTADYKVSFFGYYPYDDDAFTVQSAASTAGAPTYHYTVPSDVSSQQDVMTGQTVNLLGGGSSPVSLTMKHRCAAIHFSVTNSRSSAITLTSVGIEGVKYTGTLCEETWTLGNAVNSSSSNPFTLSYGRSIAAGATANITTSYKIFMMLPQSIPAGARLKIVINGEDPMYADLTGTWAAGKRYYYNLSVTNGRVVIVDEDTEIEDWESVSTDLSMVDNAGNERETMTTANCYLVHAAGGYRIPLVYGNAIKNGTDNRIAYYPGENSSITNGSDQFVNHEGSVISGPWITKSGSGVDAGMGLVAASAELLWQDRVDLITRVSVSGDYLKFNVGTFGSGNAVIAVKDNSGTILWSWHIWATTETLAGTTTVNTNSHVYNVAPVNLGWVPTGGDGKQGYCPFYQWGRKDPFVPTAGYNSNVSHTVYDIDGNAITGYTFVTSSTATIGMNIQNPTKFYNVDDSPVTTTYYNMWDAQNASTGNVATATKKTIYDPCPPGFCVPTYNLYYFMWERVNGSSSISFDNTNKGITWNINITGSPLWFPAAGVRWVTNGALSSVGVEGYYWAATPYNEYSGKELYFTNIYWYDSYRFRGYGEVIRPVREE